MSAIAVFDPHSSSNSYQISGYIKFEQPNIHTNTKVTVKLSGFPSNKKFACHIHEHGNLLEGCKSACAHFNPFQKLHGSFELYGQNRHVGDLAIPDGNLISNENGQIITKIFYDDLISLCPFSPANIIGRMVVIHEKADDGGKFRNDLSEKGKESGKTGNAGKRIACAVIGTCIS
jgi:Cu-Zn family superoxide dismutase